MGTPQTGPATPPAPRPGDADAAPRRPLVLHLIALARPAQWAKSVFVFIGPAYALREAIARAETPFVLGDIEPARAVAVAVAAAAFALASSACYVVNDLLDRHADRLHPRKRRRPIASGAVSPRAALIFAAALVAACAAVLAFLPPDQRWLVAAAVAAYVANVFAYSFYLKKKVIADVISLSAGFVLRVLGGCAAAGVEPSAFLLNATLFLSMFLAFGKRLGERRTLGDGPGGAAVGHRAVQERYSDAVLNNAVVVTAVATLLTYAGYIQHATARGADTALAAGGLTALWLTLMPATYALLRAIVLVDAGKYDDPTELAYHDRGFQAAAMAFALLTAAPVAADLL